MNDMQLLCNTCVNSVSENNMKNIEHVWVDNLSIGSIGDLQPAIYSDWSDFTTMVHTSILKVQCTNLHNLNMLLSYVKLCFYCSMFLLE